MPASPASLRLGFDIGGTFTDFVLSDPATGTLRLHKRLTTPEDPAIGALAGLRQILAEAGADFGAVAEIVHGTTLVTNAGHRAQGRAAGAADHRRLPRRAGSRDRAALRHLRSVPHLSRPAGAASAQAGGGRAHRPGWPGRDGAGCGGGARCLPHPGGGRCGSRGDLLPQRLSGAPARAGSRCDRRRSVAGHPGFRVLRRGGGNGRIRPLRHNRRQCLRAAADDDLPPPPPARVAGGGLHRCAALDAFGRRAGVGGCGRLVPDPPAGVGAGRRGTRGGPAGRAGRSFGPAGLRHGRHHGQGLFDRGRPRRRCPHAGSRAGAAVQEGLGPADQGGNRGHDRDRGGPAARSPPSTGSACCASGRIPPAPLRGRPATGGAGRSQR